MAKHINFYTSVYDDSSTPVVTNSDRAEAGSIIVAKKTDSGIRTYVKGLFDDDESTASVEEIGTNPSSLKTTQAIITDLTATQSLSVGVSGAYASMDSTSILLKKPTTTIGAVNMKATEGSSTPYASFSQSAITLTPSVTMSSGAVFNGATTVNGAFSAESITTSGKMRSATLSVGGQENTPNVSVGSDSVTLNVPLTISGATSTSTVAGNLTVNGTLTATIANDASTGGNYTITGNLKVNGSSSAGAVIETTSSSIALKKATTISGSSLTVSSSTSNLNSSTINLGSSASIAKFTTSEIQLKKSTSISANLSIKNGSTENASITTDGYISGKKLTINTNYGISDTGAITGDSLTINTSYGISSGGSVTSSGLLVKNSSNNTVFSAGSSGASVNLRNAGYEFSVANPSGNNLLWCRYDNSNRRWATRVVNAEEIGIYPEEYYVWSDGDTPISSINVAAGGIYLVCVNYVASFNTGSNPFDNCSCAQVFVPAESTRGPVKTVLVTPGDNYYNTIGLESGVSDGVGYISAAVSNIRIACVYKLFDLSF